MPSESNRSEPLIGGLLRLLSESVREHILETVRDRGYPDITRSHLAVFQFPSPDGASPSALADRAFMTKQAMNYLLRELEDRGYLVRRDVPGDRRSRVIFLTRRGERLVAAMKGAVNEVERRWAETIGSERFAELKGALGHLCNTTLQKEGAG